MFKLNEKIAIHVGKVEVVGTLIGIDDYVLEGFSGAKTRWPSYTLVSEQKGLFSRYWFVKWARGPWILWTKAVSGLPPKGAKIILEKSGIASIAFAGDSGASTPHAALTQYAVGRSRYFCLERFAQSRAMYFDGIAIAPPKRMR